MKLFLTGDDGVSGGARFWEARAGERSSRVKEVRKGRSGIYSHGEKLLAQRNWTNVPPTLLIRVTCVTHVQRGEHRVLSWVNRIIYHEKVERFEWQKPKIQIR